MLGIAVVIEISRKLLPAVTAQGAALLIDGDLYACALTTPFAPRTANCPLRGADLGR